MILDFGWIGGVNPELVCWVLVSGETLPWKAIGENLRPPDNFKVIVLDLC